MKYYKERNEALFRSKEAPPDVFVVTFTVRTDWRIILNFEEILEKCHAYTPPKSSNFTKVRCMTMQPSSDSFVEDLAKVDATHALVGTHGAGGTFSYFLNELGAYVEILSWDFCGSWPNMYFRTRLEKDKTIRTGHFYLKAGTKFVEPGPFEANHTGAIVAYARDRNIRVDWETLAKVLDRIALGDIESSRKNRQSRTYYYGEHPDCPDNEDDGK